MPTKVHLVKAMVFPVVMYGCESWTIKKAECPRIDAFELWCCRRFLRVPWTARRLNQSILKEINPEYSLKGLMLKLKFQYFGHLIRSDQITSVAQSCPTLCDPKDYSTPSSLVLYYLPDFAQIHVHGTGDAIQPFHLLLPASPALNLS